MDDDELAALEWLKSGDLSEEEEDERKKAVHEKADMLVAYSTVKGDNMTIYFATFQTYILLYF